MQRLEVALDAFGEHGDGPAPSEEDLREMLLKIIHHEARGWVGKREISEDEVRRFLATPRGLAACAEPHFTSGSFEQLYNDLLDWCHVNDMDATRAAQEARNNVGRRLSGSWTTKPFRERRTSWTSRKKEDGERKKAQPGMQLVASSDTPARTDEDEVANANAISGVAVGRLGGGKDRKELAQQRLGMRRPSVAMQVKVAGDVSAQQQAALKTQLGSSGENRIDFTKADAQQRARKASVSAAATGEMNMAASNMAAAMAASQAAKVGLPMDPAMEAAAAAAMVPEREEGHEEDPSFCLTSGSPTFKSAEDAKADAGESEEPPPPVVLTEAVLTEAAPSPGRGAISEVVFGEKASPPPAPTGDAPPDPLPRRPAQSRRRSSEQRRPSLGHRNSVAVSKEMGTGSSSLSFDADVVGTYSCRGMEDGVVKTNQDCACIAHPFAKQGDSGLFCVLDGHGKDGHNVSREALNTIYEELYNAGTEALRADTGNIMAAAFETANRHLQLLADPVDGDEIQVDARKSGACGLVVYAHGSTLWVGGVGDCRAVIGIQKDGVLAALSLSTDHKVDLPDEQARIESMGGWVKPAALGDDGGYNPARLYQAKDRPWLGPGLCVARALGDLDSSSCGLIATPEVVCHVATQDDKFMILATDGVWEFIENDEAVRLVNIFFTSGKTAEEACRFLIASAAMKWREYEGDYRDDITCIVIYLQSVVATLQVNAMPALGH